MEYYFYDINKRTFAKTKILPEIQPKDSQYSRDDLVYKRISNIGKLDSKFEVDTRKIKTIGVKGYWLKLTGDIDWTHINVNFA